MKLVLINCKYLEFKLNYPPLNVNLIQYWYTKKLIKRSEI